MWIRALLPALLLVAPIALGAKDADPKKDLAAVVKKVREGMKEIGLDEKGLAPRHDFIPADEWRLPLVDACLSMPLHATTIGHLPWLEAPRLRSALELAGGALRLQRRGPVGAKPVKLGLSPEQSARIPFDKRRIEMILLALSEAVSARAAAFDKLTEAEWVHLRKYGSQFNTGMPTHMQAPLLRSHHARIDVARMYRASLRVAEMLAGLRKLDRLRSGPEFHLVHETEHGRIEIGGFGRNRYEKDCLLTIDLGGDDVYANSAGGTIYTPAKVSISIDLAGDDVYRTEVGLAQGSGVYGIGMLVDCEGDDVYESKNVSQGAGHVGVGVLWDWAGDDRYTAAAVSQGAGFQGIGLLRDDGGRDVYRVGLQGQGFGGVQGFGVLLDAAGDDSYRAGGVVPDRPREPDRFLSMSQGFGLGIRADDPSLRVSGGVGLLADVAGDDTYVADVFGQGCAYWYALGVLLDGGGRDFYEVHNYGQGAGIHMAVGVQMDLAGDDRYVGRGHALGHALDRSVGFFADLDGDDVYESDDGESQGAAVKPHALGIFADLRGADTYRGGGTGYVRKPEEGREEEWPKAFFLDFTGRDVYPTDAGGPKNGETWTKHRLGWGWDAR
jgi:hypothetical protein